MMMTAVEIALKKLMCILLCLFGTAQFVKCRQLFLEVNSTGLDCSIVG